VGWGLSIKMIRVFRDSKNNHRDRPTGFDARLYTVSDAVVRLRLSKGTNSGNTIVRSRSISAAADDGGNGDTFFSIPALNHHALTEVMFTI
jgi:hypothetical protein